MAVFIRLLDLILVLLGVWADQKKQEQQRKEADDASKEISKWQNRPTSTADAAIRLRERALRKKIKP